MRKVAIDKVVPGIILSKTVFSLDGKVLLSSGVELKENYIHRLKKNGITELYVEDDISAGIEIKDVLCEQTRMEARLQVKKLMHTYKWASTVNIDEIRKTIDTIIDELFCDRELIVNLADIKSVDDYTFEHSVNVCVLSLIIGISMGFNKYKLKDLGVGAILHDIGKLRISQELLKKPSQLTNEEFEEIKKHATYGYEILRKCSNISIVSACIALTHHERYDGSGYPLQLKGENIHEFARIVAITDVYDALTSDRVYRKKLDIHKVMEYITSTEHDYFDRNIVEYFTKHIALYPAGTGIILNTGEKGLIVSVNKEIPSKPVVRVVFNSQGNRLANYYDIDLKSYANLYIADIWEM